MSDDTVLTPITPEEGVAAPPQVTPSISGGVSAAPTLKLKPVIRKPLIRKPVIGGAKPVALKPATGTPPPPAAVPEAVAEAAAEASPSAAADSSATPKLKAITSPIAAQAVLRKTGIVAEGILTPAQAQAAKTKTSRISLESAVGVAPSVKSAAPMKTIRLRRPTDLPPAGNVIKPAVNLVKPAETPAPAAVSPAVPAPSAPAAEEVAASAAPAPAVSDVPVADVPAAENDSSSEAAPEVNEPSATVTQKKTLKLRRPNFKRPTVGGLRKPGAPAAEAASPSADSAADQLPGLDTVADIPAADDIPDIKSIPSIADLPSAESNTVAGTPAWLNAITIAAGIAALIVAGLCTWSLYTQASGPEAGPNGLASFYSETDHSR